MSATETAAVPKKKSKALLLIVVLVVLLGGGGAAAFMLTRGGGHAGPPRPELGAKAEYLALDPSFVVNFQDEHAVRFLQVGISLMSHDKEAIEAAKSNEPQIRNSLLILLSGQDVKALNGTAGKLALQKQALAKVQDIVKQQIGRPGIEALYFTSFVMQ